MFAERTAQEHCMAPQGYVNAAVRAEEAEDLGSKLPECGRGAGVRSQAGSAWDGLTPVDRYGRYRGRLPGAAA